MVNKEEIKRIVKREATLELCRRDFFFYCKTLRPSFYVDAAKESEHLKILCKTIQDFVFDDTEHDTLVVNMGPRHGKSFTIQNFCSYYLGRNPLGHIVIGTYNETLSTTFSKDVRDTIQELKSEDKNAIVYSDIFPNIKIKRGYSAANIWSLDYPDAYNSYRATSPNGSATGFPASLLIIDDLVRDYEEAFNAKALEKQWDWYRNTMKSRLEGKSRKTIIIATRWSSEDLSGRILEKEDPKVLVLTMPTVVNEETHEMLCPSILSYEQFLEATKDTDARVVSANYQQITIDDNDRLYKDIKTYNYHDFCENFNNPSIEYNDNKRRRNLEIYSYCDTADEGTDYLCNIIFAFDYVTRMAYVLDVYYTQEAMEKTEIETAKRLNNYKVNHARIESNNGGRGFARNVIRELQEKHSNYRTIVKWFHQSDNKLARIRGYSSQVCKFVYFPDDWHLRWPQFFRDINKFKGDGSCLHDDCADALTGVIETMINQNGI